MSVDAGGGELKFQVAKGHQRSKQTSIFNKFLKIFRKSVQERPHILLSTSHTHINIPTCGVLFIIPSQSDCIWNPITTTLSQNTTCRDICGCDLWTVGYEVILEHVPSLPLSPYFFHQSVIPEN